MNENETKFWLKQGYSIWRDILSIISHSNLLLNTICLVWFTQQLNVVFGSVLES